jgi:hypothetical protein
MHFIDTNIFLPVWKVSPEWSLCYKEAGEDSGMFHLSK